MDEILRWLERQYSLADAKAPGKLFAWARATQVLAIKQMPFSQPVLLLVLSGQASVMQDGEACRAQAGALLAIPAAARLDARFDCDVRSGRYCALVIPFTVLALERFARTHELPGAYVARAPRALTFAADEGVHDAIKHYLLGMRDPRMQTHRLWEILSMLFHKDAGLLCLSATRARWSERVRAVLLRDLSRGWEMDEMCGRLNISANTLRRHLREEGTGFRELVYEVRLSTALTQLLHTAAPIPRIAYDCGYQSAARFTQNFYKRFGLLPRAFREGDAPSPPTKPRRAYLTVH